MPDTWMGRMVRMNDMPETGGLWKVVSVDRYGWVECEPRDDRARELASLGCDGMLWLRKRDLQEDTGNQGVLL